MTNNKIKVFIACHKPYNSYRDDVYTPIHVGRAISACTSEMQDMIGDNSGENISKKNPFYCELTAQYWMWKNIHDVEYVGLCHYRRFFETILSKENIDSILGNKFDVLQAMPRYEKISVGIRLQYTTCQEDFFIFFKCLAKLYPEYIPEAKKFLSQNICVPYNMFVMKKKLFDQFAEWQFSILFEMEKYVKLSGYTRTRRLYGYISEVLLAIYCKYNKLNVTYDYIVSSVGQKSKKDPLKIFKETFRTFRYKILGQETYFSDPSVETGFRIDNIEI